MNVRNVDSNGNTHIKNMRNVQTVHLPTSSKWKKNTHQNLRSFYCREDLMEVEELEQDLQQYADAPIVVMNLQKN